MPKTTGFLTIAIALIGQCIVMSGGAYGQDFDQGVAECQKSCLQCGQNKKCFLGKEILPKPPGCDPKCNIDPNKCYAMCKDGY